MFPISGSSMVPYMKQINQQSELFNMLVATYVIRWVKGSLDQHQQLMFISTQNICRCYVNIQTSYYTVGNITYNMFVSILPHHILQWFP